MARLCNVSAVHHDEGINTYAEATETPQMDGDVEETSSPAFSSRWFPVGALPNKSQSQSRPTKGIRSRRRKFNTTSESLANVRPQIQIL